MEGACQVECHESLQQHIRNRHLSTRGLVERGQPHPKWFGISPQDVSVLMAAVLPMYVIIVETQLTKVRTVVGESASGETELPHLPISSDLKKQFCFCSSTIGCQLFFLFLTCVCTVSSVSAYLLPFVNCFTCVCTVSSVYLSIILVVNCCC